MRRSWAGCEAKVQFKSAGAGKGKSRMVRQTGKRIAALAICMILLFTAGCSGKKEEGGNQGQIQGESQDTADQEDIQNGKDAKQKESEAQKQLKQAEKPQFIPNGIRSVSLRRDGEEFLLISREPADYKMDFDYWEVSNPYDENATMNTEVMFEMFGELCGLAFDTPVQVEEGTDTGIQESDMSYRVEYVDTADNAKAQGTEDADTAVEVILGKEDGKGGRYAAVAGKEEQVYLLPAETIRMIYDRKPFDYILKIPVLISADTLDCMEITAGNRQYEISVDASSDSYRFGKKEVDKKEFAALYQAISGVMLASEMDGGRSDKEEPELTVVFHRNIEGAPKVQVSYYSYDDEYDSVEINGEERFLVGRDEIETLIGQIEDAF